MQVRLGYPSRQEEDEILVRYQRNDPLVALKPVATVADVLALQALVRENSRER